eukprot:Awhi_evm4s4625
MYADMENAEEFIYFTGWSIYPELIMIREPVPKEKYVDLLKRKAEEGVQVVVMPWQNTVPVFTTYDKATEEAFEGSKVHVVRSFRELPFYDGGALTGASFTHHQKSMITIIGGRLKAYVGGIDLTTGRYDDQDHQLLNRTENESADDYYQNTIADPDPNKDPREPW